MKSYFRAGIQFNSNTQKNVGYISPELSNLTEEQCLKTPASKLMLYMLRGITHHWKQIVGYHFTGQHCNFLPYLHTKSQWFSFV